MAKAKFTIMTCDRCERVEEIRQDHQLYPWSEILAKQVNGPFRIGNPRHNPPESYDLCPSCTLKLERWWDQGTKAVP